MTGHAPEKDSCLSELIVMHAKGYDAGGISGDWRNQFNGVTSRDAGKGPEELLEIMQMRRHAAEKEINTFPSLQKATTMDKLKGRRTT